MKILKFNIQPHFSVSILTTHWSLHSPRWPSSDSISELFLFHNFIRLWQPDGEKRIQIHLEELIPNVIHEWQAGAISRNSFHPSLAVSFAEWVCVMSFVGWASISPTCDSSAHHPSGEWVASQLTATKAEEFHHRSGEALETMGVTG